MNWKIALSLLAIALAVAAGFRFGHASADSLMSAVAVAAAIGFVGYAVTQAAKQKMGMAEAAGFVLLGVGVVLSAFTHGWISYGSTLLALLGVAVIWRAARATQARVSAPQPL